MATVSQRPTYTGKVQPRAQEIVENGTTPYLPSQELVDAVNLAIFLEKRPLLIKGEPGSGKTRLARAVAHELGLPFEFWSVKSTSRARDGLYVFDAIRRLQDAQLGSRGKSTSQKPADASNYVRLGPLGRAFSNRKRTVVLIDEIDKADIDFPNDLLLELDEQRFVIEETGQEVRSAMPPIVFVTSNDEKDLPDAFLRRCLFHYIEFPDEKQLNGIVAAHFPDASAELVQKAIRRFQQLRTRMVQEKSKGGKKVSTSELLDWFAVLSRHKDDAILSRLDGKLPYAEVLLKSWEDHLRYGQETNA